MWRVLEHNKLLYSVSVPIIVEFVNITSFLYFFFIHIYVMAPLKLVLKLFFLFKLKICSLVVSVVCVFLRP